MLERGHLTPLKPRCPPAANSLPQRSTPASSRGPARDLISTQTSVEQASRGVAVPWVVPDISQLLHPPRQPP